MTTVISHGIDGNGFYKSYRSFINDTNGSVPYNWTLFSPLGTYQIIAAANGHNKVLEINLAGTGVEGISTQFTPAETGTIELQICKALTNNLMDIVILEEMGPSDLIKIYFNADGDIWWEDGTGNYDTTVAYAPNTWYHVKIVFDVAGTWSFEIRNAADALITSQAGLPFQGAPASLKTLLIGNLTTGVGAGLLYVDVVACSWEGNYTVGDNKTEYTNIIYKRALGKRGTHCSYKGFSAFDINKMVFPNTL